MFAQNKEININQFNVYGKDKIDDTRNFDKAIDYIAENGGTLYIPEGNYYLDNMKRIRKGVYNTGYIFLIHDDIKLKFHKNAILHYKNNFKGFRFRSTQDPNDRTINEFTIEITGGVIDGLKNNVSKVKGNPNNWAFVGETLKKFKVTNMVIQNLYGSAGITSYSNDLAVFNNNSFINVTGNPADYIDDHGDGIYIANTARYEVTNNKVINNISVTKRLARVGICIEYERSKDGIIVGNHVSGYDRGIHVEFIKGTANIYNNNLTGNSSGIVLWNNYGNRQIIQNNTISNEGLEKNNKPKLYTAAPILILGLNQNSGTVISNNRITVYRNFFIPNNLLQITSSDMKISGNIFLDYTKTLSLSISQGDSHEKQVKRITFTDNEIMGSQIYAFDGSELMISDNKLDVNEISLSFDKSDNVYRNNIFIKKNARIKQNMGGNYRN